MDRDAVPWDGDAVPDPRAITLPTALLVATAAIACPLAVGGMFLLLTLVVASGHTEVALHGGGWAVWCAAAACACGTVATLIAQMHRSGGLRPPALAAAWALAFAWPLTGVAAMALAATLAIGFVVRWGVRGPSDGEDRLPIATALAAAALVLVTAAFGGAGDTPRAVPEEARADTGAAPARESSQRPRSASRSSQPSEPPAPPAVPSDPGDEPAPPVPAAVPPARVVRTYYRALDRRDFTSAWRLLAPAVQTAFGGFERWRAGFATTLSSRPGALRVTAAGDGAAIEHVLTARDEASCGVLVQRFSVRWQLQRTPEGWRATSLTAAANGAGCA